MEEAQTVASMVASLYEAFNRRDIDAVIGLCHPEIEFLPVTAEFANRNEPYIGHDGMRRYFADVEETWDELKVTPSTFHEDIGPGPELLVTGRVVARSKERGLRDMPAAWVWRLNEGLVSYGRVYEDPREAARAVGVEL